MTPAADENLEIPALEPDSADAPEPETAEPDPRLRLHPQFHSRFLTEDRDIIVCLPPGYEESPETRYSVLYMHDGQNLFDPATSFVRGRTWQMKESSEALTAAGEIEPLIIVGIYNTPRRIDEYTHAQDAKHQGGNADDYGRMIVDELKPFIDAEYRTLPGEDNTAMGGSSLGGLVTLYLGVQHAAVFSRLAVFSPSIWWNYKSILSFVNDYEGPPWPKIWLSMGSAEAKRAQPDADLLYKRLVVNGWKPEITIHYERVPGGTHDETAWAEQVKPMLRFLFPARGPDQVPR